MGSQKRIPAGRECFVHFGLNCSNPVGFELAEGFGMFARFSSTGLDVPGGQRANDGVGCVRFLNNAGVGFGFHVLGCLRFKVKTCAAGWLLAGLSFLDLSIWKRSARPDRER